jgi:hypothetical protein
VAKEMGGGLEIFPHHVTSHFLALISANQTKGECMKNQSNEIEN